MRKEMDDMKNIVILLTGIIKENNLNIGLEKEKRILRFMQKKDE